MDYIQPQFILSTCSVQCVSKGVDVILRPLAAKW